MRRENTILEDIVAAVRRRLVEKKEQIPLAELERYARDREPPHDMKVALKGEDIRFIAEVKRASPSKGWLCPELKPSAMACYYARGGAAAISVLTEPDFFKGSLTDLAEVRRAVELPLLRKDFTIDPYQVYEARVYGADALLLIVSVLSDKELKSLLTLTHDMGMSALVEVHNENEVERALASRASLIGINNRNLKDFSVNIETSLRLRPLLPPEVVVVSESGINSAEDVQRLRKAGIDAVLVGTALVTSADPEAKLRELAVRRQA